MTNLEILQKMRELLSDPEHWTQGERFNGVARYCIVGAYEKVTRGQCMPSPDDTNGFDQLNALHDEATKLLPMHSLTDLDISFFNDQPGTTHAMILDMLDYRIAEERNNVFA